MFQIRQIFFVLFFNTVLLSAHVERVSVSCMQDFDLSSIINRLGVAGAVLQTPLSFTRSPYKILHHIVATRLLFVDTFKCLISFKKDALLDSYEVNKH